MLRRRCEGAIIESENDSFNNASLMQRVVGGGVHRLGFLGLWYLVWIRDDALIR